MAMLWEDGPDGERARNTLLPPPSDAALGYIGLILARAAEGVTELEPGAGHELETIPSPA